jgi:uncharacterized protein (DUF885 family)
MIDRRALMQAAAGVALAGMSGVRTVLAAVKGNADAKLAALLQRLAEDYFRSSPEDATRFGYDTGANAAQRSRLDDRSLEAIGRNREAANRAVAELARIDRAALSASAALDHDVATFVYGTLKEQLAQYGYVDINLRPSPYVVSQMNGAYYWLPDFLGSDHPIASAPDVDAYLARLNALGAILDQETRRIGHDAGLGVIPPAFVLAKTIAQIQSLRDTPPAQTAMIAPVIERAKSNGLGDVQARAEQAFRKSIVPALSRQIAALQALTSKSTDKAGVWALPDGEAYYASAVRSNTTSTIAIPELHRVGLQQVADITAQLDRALRAQGYSSGSVAQRITALNHDERFLVSDDDEGRQRLLAAAREMLDSIRAKLPAAFKTIPNDPIEVRRTPVAIENGAPGAFYSEGVGGRPGTFSLNLKSPADLPLWRLPTLAHHEGIPGHHFQFIVLKAAGELPLFRRLVRFSAYTEGWALYAERLADEIGIYEKDPVGRIGLMQSELFRAARIVVDTGIHHHRWTREQATKWMIENAGEQPAAAEREIDRYCVYPGQACSFMVGANEIRASREAARKRMGVRFDVREFHDLVLRSGPVPLAVLKSAVEQWSRRPIS